MNIRITLLFCLVFLFFSNVISIAKPINIIEAEKIAESKLLQHSKFNYTILYSESVINEFGTSLFYTIHLNPVGYVIVPGDDLMVPILAYSFQDNIDPYGKFVDFLEIDIQKRFNALNKIPQSIIKTRQKQRNDLIKLNFNKEKFEQWPPEGTTSTGGWLETNWHQNAPYNEMCPVDPTNGTRSIAGCPSVAMAMIINYHQTINNTTFTDEDDYYHNYAGRTYWIDDDYETTGFPCFPDLNSYLDTLVMHYESQTVLTDNDMAALTFACGVACKQVYTSGGSGTFGVNQAYDAFIKFACEDIELLYEDHPDFFARLSQNMMDSLPAHLAVLVDGGPGGHNVVVDGYNTDNYYHVNFGWGGSYNAWYILPDEFPYSLTIVEGVIIDIMKPEPVIMNSKYENSVRLFPNPAYKYFSINNNDVSSVCIYNLNGSLISITTSGYNYIEISDLKAGTYVVKITEGSGRVSKRKLCVIK